MELDDLAKIASRLEQGVADSEDIEKAANFICGNTRGFKHNRTRSWLARNISKSNLTGHQGEKLVASIMMKLRSGDIDENFKDQLRLVLRIDPDEFYKCAHELMSAEKEYVARYAAKMLRMRASSNNSLQGRRP